MSLPYRELSLWLDTAGDDLTPRPPLAGDLDVDVAIVGAGYSGLWTAYYLAAADPSLRIAVLEAEIAGYGASGQNGGWCSALFPATKAQVARRARGAARGAERDGAVGRRGGRGAGRGVHPALRGPVSLMKVPFMGLWRDEGHLHQAG